ncbi:MAG TPA: sulfite exporter TauE/SafE family protein [Steroidobacteraceae bacterium]|nr:sulfite exporter TauE/SafE family protein [Steroidobacteraceae bacterium]
MHELTFVTALLAGVLGSTHCFGMCGGIATALGAVPGGASRTGQLLLYHCGRIVSYATAGAIAGSLGAAAGFAFDVSRWSEILRLATAVMVVVIGLDIAWSGTARGRWLKLPERWGARLWRRVAPRARGPLPASSHARALALGLLWGWLPCGLVYSVLLAAAVAGGAASGAATMIAFGLGTVPAMAGLSLVGARLPRPGGSLARLLGAALVACGLWTAVLPIAALSGAHQHHHHEMASAAVESAGRLR